MESVIVTASTVLVGLIVTALFNGLINFPKKKKAQDDKMKDDIHLLKKGIQALLKNDLKVRYDHWLDAGYCPEDSKNDLEKEYQIYHALGKNGVMDSKRNEVLRLPSESPEE